MTKKSAEKIIIGIAGNIGAGKGTVREYIQRKYQAKTIAYSDILKDILQRLHLAINRQNLANLANCLRSTFGENILSAVLEQDIQQQKGEIIVFEGIRKKAELDYFKKKSDNFFLLFVDTPLEVAYQRLLKRQEKVDDQTKTLAEFKKDYQHSADRDVPKLKQWADFVIDNSRGLKQTFQQIDEIMAIILQSSKA